MHKRRKRNHQGFMLIEALTILFIFSLVVVTFYSVFNVGIHYIQDAKNRLGALAVANERIEIIRNLHYDNVGTLGGEITGNIPQDQAIVENGHHFDVHTEIFYVDDPFDGLAYSDTVWFEDYKKVVTTVSWNNSESTGNIEIISRFVPPGKEVPHIGDGILSINVFSDQDGGASVAGARVQIYNPETGINTSRETDSAGNVTFMGSTVTDSIQKYQLTVTKLDYETVETMAPYPTTEYSPVDVHASVVTGSMNVKNIIQNKTANIKVSTLDYLDQPIAQVDFHLRGGRELGTRAEEPFLAVYNFDEDLQTNSSGEEEIESVSPGEYNFSLTDSALEDYEIISTEPAVPFSLLSSAETLDVFVKLASREVTSCLVNVLDEENDSPVVGAKVKLINATLNYEKELTVMSNGKVFFPDSSDPFLPETYELKVTADGYEDEELTVVIEENELKVENIKLQLAS